MGLSLIRASNGNGEAVQATVTTIRASGSTTINVDSLTNWPQYFFATSGTLLPDGTLDQTTVLAFAGHKSGSQIIIDSVAPGYIDDGNTVGQIIIVKPSTPWANNIADFLGVSLKEDGSIKQIEETDPGLLFSASATQPAPDSDGRVIIWFEPLES